jgi:hypothetical protein
VNPRVDTGEVGYTIEFGRPGVGVHFSDIHEMTKVLASKGVTFEKNNPITHLMTQIDTGEIRSDILDEKILSAIVEIKTTIDRLEEVLETVDQVNQRIDTVVAIGISTKCDEKGEDSLLAERLDDLGVSFERAKTNLGLGRITNSTIKSDLED